MRSDQPLVSILMNCYNGERYLRAALDSILAQTYQNWELIFWDNQSTDSSAEIFKSYKNRRFKYFYAPTHTLLYEARNYAIEKTSGEFFAFLDVDDWWRAEKLEMQVPLFDDPEVGFVCSNCWIANERKRTRRLYHKRAIPSGWVLNDLLMDYPGIMSTFVFRGAAFDSLEGGFDPRFLIFGDMDSAIRLAMKWKMACCQEPLAYYRLHGENIGQTQRARHAVEFQILVEKLGKNPDILGLSGYKKVVDELIYIQGRLCIDQNRKGETIRYLSNLPWGKFKIKLWVWLVTPRILLRLIGF